MSNVFLKTVQVEIESYGFTVADKDFSRPWGGFLVIDEEEAQAFANKFFVGIDVETLRIEGKLSLKILVVRPEARLSWQYHHCRAEIWQVFRGIVGITRSNDDTEGDMIEFEEGEQVKLAQGYETIPERPICEKMGIALIEGLGDKIQSSSWLLKKL